MCAIPMVAFMIYLYNDIIIHAHVYNYIYIHVYIYIYIYIYTCIYMGAHPILGVHKQIRAQATCTVQSTMQSTM